MKANTAGNRTPAVFRWPGPLLILMAAVFFTMLNLLIKSMGPDFRVWDIAFYRFFGGVCVLVGIFGRHGNPFKGYHTRLLIIRGCTGSVAFLSVIAAIRLLPISTALVLFYSFPAFAALFSFLIYREQINRWGVICVTAVILGVAVLLDFRAEGNLTGQIMGVVGGLFAGLTVTFIKELRNDNGPVIIYLYFCTVGLLVTAPVFAVSPVFPRSGWEWMMCLGIIASSVTAQLLMNEGFSTCKSWEGGVIMSSEVIFTMLVGILFLHDPVNWRFWTGSLMILGSVLLLNIMNAKKTVRPLGVRR